MLTTVIIATLIAGLAMPLGALIASYEHIKSNWLEEEFRHTVMAFGGGTLLSAVALVLIPESIEHLSTMYAASFFLLGGLAFMAFDIYLNKSDAQAGQLTAMLSDFIPESIALGAAFATGSDTAMLLAILITLQNIPEGFNAYREIQHSIHYSRLKIITIFSLMALLGPLAGITGYLWLKDFPFVLAAIMMFASGGILYSIFQDIAPQVKLEKHYEPPMGAVLGFMLGLIGLMLTTAH